MDNLNRKKVKVTWHGNRVKRPFEGLQYSTVAKFDENWHKETWSIVLDFEIPPSQQGNPSFGTARFLVAEGPHEILIPGFKFELYEGSLTAEVLVL